MIDQLPEHRTLPDDVRLRIRRRLAEGMNAAPSTRAPLLVAAGVSLLAVGAVFAGQVLYGTADVAGPDEPRHQVNGEFVGKDSAVVNHVERGKVAPDALARCTAAAKSHPPAQNWQTIATSHKNGTTLTAFRVPAGVFFCANTATTTTISAPDGTAIEPGQRTVKVLFTTPTGAMAGLVSQDLKFLSLSRISGPDHNSTASPALVDGLFLAPSGYLRPETGTVALANGEEFALQGLPTPTAAAIDRPLPPADRSTPEARRFADCLRDRPIADPDQFALGVTVNVSATSTVMLGRFGDVLIHCVDGADPLRAFSYDPDDLEDIRGTTVVAAPAFYDFAEDEKGVSSSANMVAIGLVLDPRVASITYTSPGKADVSASIGNGTFVLGGRLIDRAPGSRVVVRDANGAVLETITPRDTP
jgi:hypothetical protein